MFRTEKIFRVMSFIILLTVLIMGAARAQNLSLGIETKFNKEITLDLRDMDIVDVYKFLSMKGDFSIVISKSVEGRATLVLKTVTIGDALDIISIANGLSYRDMKGIIYIMPESEHFAMFGTSFRDKTKVKIVYLSYVRPGYALETLKNIKSNVGKIIIDEDTGTLVMIDTDEKIKEMEDVLEKIDYRLETKVYPLSHAEAEDVKEKLRERLDVKSVGTIAADERSNQVIVSALPGRFPEIETLIKALDKETKEVLIKLTILQLTYNPQFDFGINWEKTFSDSKNPLLRSLDLVGSFPISSNVSTINTLGTVGKIALGTLAGEDFTIELKALRQIDDVNTLASPSILITDGEEAQIHIGDKLAYITTTTTGTGADQTANEEVHYVDVGVLLKVEPHIGEDGFVRMRLEPEISTQTSTLETVQGAKIPVVNTTKVETTVMVKSGTTIFIGGLHKDEEKKTVRGIPVLMDLPLIGNVFRNVYEEVTKTEIVIMLTPIIVDGEMNMVGYTPTMAPRKEYEPVMAPMKKY